MAEGEPVAPVTAAPAAPVPAQPASPDPTATLTAQLSAADRARVQAEKDRDTVKAERDQYAARLAEIEGQSKSELEKAIEAKTAAEKRVAEAEAKAARVELAAKHPVAAAFFGDGPLPSEEVLTALDAKLNTPAAPAAEPTAPPSPPPPNPGRAEPVTVTPKTRAELRKAIEDQAPSEMPEWYER